ncbi:MAG: Site-2 protease, Metallo peptidase, MEROPS family M50B [Clostridia bacterium 41_269]|nr:MAG: Site-2 protease, Metallo peptidase, MEROPS family M50B [Clostridia bacterium 41_269]
MTVLLSLLILSLLILVHEWGHFLAAKKAGIQVYEFSIGMGPAIISRVRGETKYSIRLLPIGGYVKMAGMEPGDENNPKGFNKKSIFQRAAVVSAGSLMNFLLAVVLFVFVFTVIGIPSDSNVVGEVMPSSPAEEAGIKPGDKILAIEDKKINNWNDLVEIIHKNPEKRLHMVVQRENLKFTVSIVPYLDKERNIGLIGIKQSVERQDLLNSIYLGINNALNVIFMIILGFAKMIIGEIPAEVAGPVGIVTIIGDVARFGLANILNFTAVLSLNLGLINLFSIPALDGSRLMFILIEWLRGKPIDPQKENFIHFIGFAILILIMLIITYQDIVRIFG